METATTTLGYGQNLSEKTAKKAASTPEHFSAYDLAGITGKTRQAIVLRADKESWLFETIPVRGGRQKLFALNDLPPDLTKTIRIHFGEIPPDLAECVPSDFDTPRIARCSRIWDAAQEWQRRVARDRKAVLDAIDRLQAAQGMRRTVVDRFVELFKAHDVPGLEPGMYSRITRMSRSQLYEWRRAFDRDGIAGLMPNYGSNRGQMKIPPDQRDFIAATWKDNPHLGAGRIAESLAARFNAAAASAKQVGKFLRTKRAEDPQTFAFCESPDGWRSRYMLALGNASEKAEHFLHWVEVDSTSADVMCSDNRRYAILGLIDVFSRKCKFVVCPTSNSWGIAGLLHATVMDWGIPENLMRDNGQDYASRMTNGALMNLGVKVRAARPFNPQEKPHVERVFGTMCRHLFEVLPGYVGHSVADRKKIEDRKSFAAKLAGKKTIQLGLTARELQDAIDGWTEQVYHQRRHGSLGASPNAKAASVPYRPRRIEDPRALDILLARPAGGKDEPTRTVGKKGLQFENGQYWGDGLIDYIGRPVLIRLDLRDAGRLFCFDPHTRAFIGDARDMALSGMTVGDKIAARKRASKTVREKSKALKVLAQKVGDPFAQEFAQAKRDAKIRNLPVGEPIRDNPFLDAAMQAADLVRREEETSTTQPISPPRRIFTEPEPMDPKVALFQKKQATCKQDIVFKNERDRFDYLRLEQRVRGLEEKEIRWVLTNLNLPSIQRHIHMFSADWEECDRLWLGRIAPAQFPMFVRNDSRGEIR